MSVLVEVVHFADAACPWDYSAEPVRVALQERYGAQLRWRTVQVGLHESGASMALRGFTTDGLRESYREFQRRFGMHFCMLTRTRLHGSWPGARMVKAAEMQGPAARAALLRRLRLAWFLDVRPMDDGDELLALGCRARGYRRRPPCVRFRQRDEPASAPRRHDARPTPRPGRTCPRKDRATTGRVRAALQHPDLSLRGARPHRDGAGIQPLGTYELMLDNVAPELESRLAVAPAEFLARHAGEPMPPAK